MYQYYINKSESQIDSLKLNIQLNNRLFVNTGLEQNYKYIHIEVDRSTFSKISFNKINLQHSNFRHCTFIDCYFRHSYLRHIIFENCVFINCKFSDNTIENCDFNYTEWDSTTIKYDELCNSFPIKYNHKSRLCKVIAKNFLEDGNLAEYRKFFYESIKAREEHYKEIISRRNEYYKNTYNLHDSISYIPKLIFSKISGTVWGHGEKIRHIIFSSITIIFIFSLIYSCSSTIKGDFIKKYTNALYVSFCNFLTISSNITFSNEEVLYRNLTVVEGFIGTIFAGLFITALVKKISVR